MPSVGVRYTQIATTRVQAVRACPHCQWQQRVEVLGVGVGTGDASHLLGNYQAAQARSAQAATRDAQRKAQLMIGLVHCPKCGRRNQAVARRFIAGVVSKCALIGLAAALIAAFVFHSASGAAVLIAGSVGAALTVAVYAWAAGPFDPLKQARLCVKFLEG